jgi:hypothetical protein
MDKSAKSKIELGERFIMVNSKSVAWEVRALFVAPGGISHARLRQVNTPKIERTYSEIALRDLEIFRRA